MKLIVLDFIVGQNPFQKLWEDALPALEEQLVVRRRRDHDDVTTLFRLIAEIPGDDAFHYVHGLRTATKAEDTGIRLADIVVLWKHDLVMNGGSADFVGLVEHLGSDGMASQNRQSRRERENRPSAVFHLLPPGINCVNEILLHRGSSLQPATEDRIIFKASEGISALSLPAQTEQQVTRQPV